MTEDKQTLLAAVADRPAADLIAELVRQVDRLHKRVAVLEGTQPVLDDGYGDGPDLLALTLNGKVAATLVAADYASVAAVRSASDADLLAVSGIDAKTLKFIRSKIGGSIA